jgi:hypothetical protein
VRASTVRVRCEYGASTEFARWRTQVLCLPRCHVVCVLVALVALVLEGAALVHGFKPSKSMKSFVVTVPPPRTQ